MVSIRLTIWTLGAIFLGLGVGFWIGGFQVLAIIALAVGVVVVLALYAVAARQSRLADEAAGEAPTIENVDEHRRNELVRGTSMHLRDMKYRYSIRHDRGDRAPFTAEVNTVVLGFVPIIILDTASGRQGQGFVAFPYDGRRWRGPGLPCGGDRGEALSHAARCVAPLDDDPSQAT